MKTLIIDNYDSFTFNLYQMIAEVNGEEPIVLTNDEAEWPRLKSLACDNIVISPGPGRPEIARDFGVCRAAILETNLPLLGVCLGHEGIGHLSGGSIVHAPEVMHGRLSPVYHDGNELFAGIPQGAMVVRYHSLVVADGLPEVLERTAWTGDGIVMGLRHRTRPIWGVQFHPESICTEHGDLLLRNFRDITRRAAGRTIFPAAHGGARAAHAEGSRNSAAHERPAYELRSRRLHRLMDAEQVFTGLYGAERHAFWLDSSRVEEGLSRFSFMGSAGGPLSMVASYHTDSRHLAITEGAITFYQTRSIFEFLEEELARRRCSADHLPFDFTCGFAGYLGYELKSECGADRVHASSLPDACVIFADRIIAFDHQEREMYLVALVQCGGGASAEAWFDEIEARLAALPPAPPIRTGMADEPTQFRLSRDHQTYLDDIERCQEYINEGESYEICLTNQIRTHIDADPLDLYRTLRSVNPAPYAAFLRFGELSVLCSSPERFLRVQPDGWVESKPIKGTRPRAAGPAEDEMVREELRACVKDRAENLMIVDLIRNDLGRVCEVGSVHVPKLMHVESYATVHQLVSTIRGRLRPDATAVDCIRAAFPGGSMTGAPKLRTMEIIDRLEHEARGIYSGAIGFLGVNGSADLNIVIRTVVMTPETASMGVGGAIVALSDPEAEFEEILIKAKAQIHAIVETMHGRFAPGHYELAGAEVITV